MSPSPITVRRRPGAPAEVLLVPGPVRLTALKLYRAGITAELSSPDGRPGRRLERDDRRRLFARGSVLLWLDVHAVAPAPPTR